LRLPTRPPTQPSGQPLICTDARPSSSTLESACDRRHLLILRPALQWLSSLRLRSIFRLSLLANLQLSLSFSLPALPSNLTSDSHRQPNPLALPSSSSATVVACEPSGPACEPSLRLTSAAASPAQLSCLSPAFAFNRLSGLPFELNCPAHRPPDPFGAAFRLPSAFASGQPSSPA